MKTIRDLLPYVALTALLIFAALDLDIEPTPATCDPQPLRQMPC